jgi:lysozyme
MKFGKKTIGGGAAAIALAAAAFIQPWEGTVLTAYPDRLAGGIPTVCSGETRGVKLGDTYTLEECEAMLAEAVVEFRDEIRPCFDDFDALPAGVQVAVISWAYNVGSGAACRSTLARLANAGDLVGACNQLPRWNRAGGRVVRGLSNRRGAERALCLESVE